ncbi:hypothetical protein F4777DRAFT_589611 [Nemania sp. FL0916]|nr:hypothetical protein F4777DRAFT_589611 [Nemania sp. FL0916]
MASFGRAQASLASFTNENTAAIININLDFTLFRCDAKPEFLPIGSALSPRRREEAENGPIHRTACTLGFLFSDTLPDTPALHKAYGRRVSEILAQPNINPQGTASDGPFQSFVGADCTSIWAAATSSDASIAVHLLACMLARAFDSKTATSIWFEIIQERKQQVNQLLKENRLVHPYTIMASKQEITRSELGTWDTSARAWLRRADESKKLEKHQFAIIVENINLPYTATGTTYSKVMTTWTKSMEVLNNLLANNPQQACDRAVLLAISSWHLHPKLIVFQDKTTEVDFKDQLFPSSAVLTLGLEYQLQAGGSGIRWSLALSHLRYYGDPVAVRSNEEMSRVTMRQFSLVALGSIFRLWDLEQRGIVDAIDWLDALGDIISSNIQEEDIEINWVRFFCSAAKSFHDHDKAREDVNLRLVTFGWRRASNLFGINRGSHLPFFGLCNPYVLGALREEDPINTGFTYLRGLLSTPNFNGRQVLVSFTMDTPYGLYCELVTAIPVPSSSPLGKSQHHRWLYFDNPRNLTPQESIILDQRQKAIHNMGESCKIISNPVDVPRIPLSSQEIGRADLRLWPNLPSVLKLDSEAERLFRVVTSDAKNTTKRGFSTWIGLEIFSDLVTQHVRSRSNEISSIQSSIPVIRQFDRPRSIVEYLRSIILPGNQLKRKRSADNIDDAQYYIYSMDNTRAAHSWMTRQNKPSRQFLFSIVALQIATMLYDQLPGATVSLRVVETELHNASWLPDSFTEDRGNQSSGPIWLSTTSASDWLRQMTRPEAFGCQLTDVLALCTEDSIFVAGIMLRDPSSSSTKGPEIRHLVGSIGHAGVVFLVSPINTRVRQPDYNALSVQHKEYDGKRENKFGSVSLHLSFTEWKMPLDWANTGEIDQQVFLLESILSVMNGGQWIGDIDVLEIEKTPIDVFETDCKGDCEAGEIDEYVQKMELISLDTWEELLDPPPAVAIFRAKTNWAARLAAVSILSRRGDSHSILIIGGTELCWKCLVSHYAYPEPHLPQIVID